MKKLSALAIAFTYVGTLVGAGFASGQELKKYFADFGVYGVIGLGLSSFLFFYLGKKIMILCKDNDADTYDKLLKILSNNNLARIFDFFITVFLIGSLTTMSAGLGSMLDQVFSIPVWLGSLALILFTIFIVKKGINEISKLNVFIVPILIGVTIIVSITSIKGCYSVEFVQDVNFVRSMFSAILYVAYNIVMSISILPSLALIADEKSISDGTMWAGIIIGGLGLLIFLALVVNYDIIQNVEIPLALLSNKFIGFYIIIFILEVFSTAVSSLYGVYGRVNKSDKVLYCVSLFAYFFSLFGFSNLVTYLYGIMGVIGIFMISVLLR